MIAYPLLILHSYEEITCMPKQESHDNMWGPVSFLHTLTQFDHFL